MFQISDLSYLKVRFYLGERFEQFSVINKPQPESGIHFISLVLWSTFLNKSFFCSVIFAGNIQKLLLLSSAYLRNWCLNSMKIMVMFSGSPEETSPKSPFDLRYTPERIDQWSPWQLQIMKISRSWYALTMFSVFWICKFVCSLHTRGIHLLRFYVEGVGNVN